MFRALFALLFVATFACAQIQELATTDDGSVVHFATPMRLVGTNEGPQGKIFKWDGSLQVVIAPNATPLGFKSVSASAPVLSGDGSVHGYTLSCFASTCGQYVYKGAVTDARGRALLSHNGRWALRGWGGKGTDAIRLDLSTGALAAQSTSVFGLTDSGDVLTMQGNRLYLGERLVATAPGKILDATTSADGSRVVYVTQHDGLLDLREGDAVLVSMADGQTGLRAELGADGGRLLVVETILDTQRAFWQDRYLPERHDLGIVRDGRATISGNGRVVWLVDNDGRLKRVPLDGGATQAVTEALPARLTISGSPVRGSLNRLEGAGLGDGPWLVTLVSQTERTILPMTVLEAKADHVDFQVPWNLAETYRYNWLGVGRPNGTFEQVLDFVLSDLGPRFWNGPEIVLTAVRPVVFSSLVKAVHENYDRLVTSADPAQPGEVVHVYMSGLGPVSPAQSDNIAATAPPPAITNPLTCSQGVSSRVLFAGLSVGLVGVYQLELEIPRSGAGQALKCSVVTPTQTTDISGYLPVAQP